MSAQNQHTNSGPANLDAFLKTASVAAEGVKEIGAAYAELLSQSTARTTAALQTLLAVQSPTDLPPALLAFAKSTLDTAIVDGRKFQELVTAITTKNMASLTGLLQTTADTATTAAQSVSTKVAKIA